MDLQRFTELVETYQAGLRAFIRALGAEEAWVDDLAQEVFLVAYQRWDQFDQEKDFGKWLRGIARHLVMNERRKTARRARIIHEALSELLQDQTVEPEFHDQERIASAIQECVSQLPERSRQLLRSRYEQGGTAAVLARSLKMKADAVRQALLRIRVTVRQCVENKLKEPWTA